MNREQELMRRALCLIEAFDAWMRAIGAFPDPEYDNFLEAWQSWRELIDAVVVNR